ncbi:MAG: hypothetical protein ACFCBW_09260 [Candidatus Competibacterales bacterium]
MKSHSLFLLIPKRFAARRWLLSCGLLAAVTSPLLLGELWSMATETPQNDAAPRVVVTAPLGEPVTALEGHSWPRHSDGLQPLSSTMIQHPLHLEILLPSGRRLELSATAATLASRNGRIAAVEPLPLPKPLPYLPALARAEEMATALGVANEALLTTFAQWREPELDTNALGVSPRVTAVALEQGVRFYVYLRPHRTSGNWFIVFSAALWEETPQ